MSELQQRIEAYYDARLTGGSGYLKYYDDTARRMKRRHLQSRATAAIGAVLVPVAANLPWELTLGSINFHVATALSSLIGLVVALILALEGVFHFKDQWQNYRGTEQYLLSQKFRFENSVDEYRGLEEEEAFKLFVLRIEKAILDENNVTLNILGRTESSISVTNNKTE